MIRTRANADIFLWAQKSESVADLAALKALVRRPETVLVKSGSGSGVWQWVNGSSTTADDALVVQCTSGVAGRYKRVYDGPIYAAWFGASPTATAAANSTAINAALTAANALGVGEVVVGGGYHNFSSKITLVDNVVLRGENASLVWTGGASVAIGTPTTGVVLYSGLSGFEIDMGSASIGIQLLSLQYSTLRSIRFLSNSTTNILLDLGVNTTGSTAPDGSRNHGSNSIYDIQHVGECGKAIRIAGYGASGPVTTNITFENLALGSCAIYGIELVGWTDNVVFSGDTRMAISQNSSVGVIINTLDPTNNVGIYGYTWEHLAVDSFGTRTNRIGISMGNTKEIQVKYFYQYPEAEGGSIVSTADTVSYSIFGVCEGEDQPLVHHSKGVYEYNDFGIGALPGINRLLVQKTVDGDMQTLLYNPSTGASSSALLSMNAGGRFVQRYVYYTSQTLYEVGSNIPSRVSAFDTHEWRNTAGTQTGILNSTGVFTLPTAGGFVISTRGSLTFSADGVALLRNAAATDFSRIQLGGSTSSFPAIKRNAAAINFRLADDSADAAITAAAGTFSGLVLTPATSTSSAGLRVPHGAAPSAPVDGDMWTTTSGLYVRINGATVGPLS